MRLLHYVFRVKSIFRLLFCSRAVTTSPTQPCVWICKKEIQLQPNAVYENILTLGTPDQQRWLPGLKFNVKFRQIKDVRANFFCVYYGGVHGTTCNVDFSRSNIGRKIEHRCEFLNFNKKTLNVSPSQMLREKSSSAPCYTVFDSKLSVFTAHVIYKAMSRRARALKKLYKHLI